MPVFVDTNVFVYRFDSSEPDKQQSCDRWVAHLWSTGEGRLSTQVIQEFYVNVTAELNPGMERAAARSVARSLFAWRPVLVDETIITSAWQLQDRHAVSWWDALIVAAAHAAGCERLLTEDLGHGDKLSGVEIVNPMVEGPPSPKSTQ